MTTTARWNLDDGTTNYDFAVNPNQMSSPWFDVTVSAKPTTSPDGRFILSEGARQPKELTISGVILAQDQYDQLVLWKNKRRRVYLTDHFNRRMLAFITSFTPKPKQRATWMHEYDMTFLLLSEPVTQ